MFNNLNILRLLARGAREHLLFLVFFTLALLEVCFVSIRPTSIFGGATGDLLTFWAAGRSFLHGGNPYDSAALAEIIREVRPEAALSQLLAAPLYNPPIILPWLALLGWFDFHIIRLAWMLISTAIFCFSAITVQHILYRRTNSQSRDNLRDVVPLVSLLLIFLPFSQHIALGQLSVILLLLLMGLILTREYLPVSHYRDGIDGFLISLSLWKPHVLYLVSLAYIWSALLNRRFYFFIGALFGLLVLAGPILLRIDIFEMYRSADRFSPLGWMTPTLGTWLEILLERQNVGLRFLPTVLAGGAVCLFVFFSEKSVLTTSGLIILALLSTATTPYIWTYDFIVVLPALILCLMRSQALCNSGVRLSGQAIICSLFLSNGIIWLQSANMFKQAWYPWALLILVLSAERISNRSAKDNC